jgi:putative oxidoreductase
MSAINNTAAFVGRVLLSLIFLMSGVHKLTAWPETAAQMEAEGLPAVQVLLPIAVAAEIVGGLALLLGCFARLGALGLILFLIPTTLVFHDFWTYSGDEQQQQMIHFMKNLAILGGLFVVLGFGPGCCSLDRRSQKSAGA